MQAGNSFVSLIFSLYIYIIYHYSNAHLFITAPNIFHVGVEETISVIVYNSDKPVTVTVIAQDFPDKNRNLTAASGVFTSGNNLQHEVFRKIIPRVVMQIEEARDRRTRNRGPLLNILVVPILRNICLKTFYIKRKFIQFGAERVA